MITAMKWLLKLLRIGGPAPKLALANEVQRPDEGKLVAELCMDFRGATDGINRAADALKLFHDEGLIHVVDWADSPDMVLQNLEGLFDGDKALPESQIEGVVKTGEAAGKAGRGHASYPTLCALDDALKGTGTRLLNLDTSGDSFNIARVPDDLWNKWHDVAFSMIESGGEYYCAFSALRLKPGNDRPANQILGVAPR